MHCERKTMSSNKKIKRVCDSLAYLRSLSGFGDLSSGSRLFSER